VKNAQSPELDLWREFVLNLQTSNLNACIAAGLRRIFFRYWALALRWEELSAPKRTSRISAHVAILSD
jgi:hypothetical protein